MSMRETHLSRSGLGTSGLMNGPMNPSATQSASFEAWQAVVAPGDVFRHPREVLAHPLLSREEKRTILASWVSDACALENAPGLRCLTGARAEPVTVEALLTALAELDGGAAPETTAGAPRPATRRRPRLANLHRYLRPRRRNDDDEPPPCPATIMPRPRTPPSADAIPA
ncbi:hypothetical protein [Methylobacterium sp. Leaf106]|uniref:hypothetical protein n=1 Tax=Methylobacterium sp. Leaf106 TaxID=1736255 RepID=UPI0007021178|nr:hypothetical protein [Methylobacterium sp. Leaf106]KQP39175.1 hypothetical protein ASF34_15390 [Methylobacterium sp. Leaf106]